MAKIKAISFDLWDTVFVDDSDEPKRRERRMPPKLQARRNLVQSFVSKRGAISGEEVDAAYGAADAAFRKVWHENHITWTVSERLEIVLAGVGRTIDDEEFARLVKLHEEMELMVKPDLVPGVAQAIEALAARYTLVVISDAIFSPGWALRKLLEGYDLLDHFAGCVFSDELGRSKPAPDVFLRAAEIAGCGFDNLVHIGDREHNDVAGAHALGAKAVLFTGARDRGSADTEADAVCSDYAELPGIIEGLG